MKLCPAEWVYLNEGNKHVVLLYTGTEPSLLGKVMRLKKKEEQQEEDKVHQLDQAMNRCFRGWLQRQGAQFVIGDVVDMEREEREAFVREVAERVEEGRPEKRRGR